MFSLIYICGENPACLANEDGVEYKIGKFLRRSKQKFQKQNDVIEIILLEGFPELSKSAKGSGLKT